MVNPPKLTGLNRVVGKSGVVYTETKMTLPRHSKLIVLQNPPMLHQFTEKSANWLMENPPKLN
jgi:hypothetical protein